ncbi:hypothetical protein PspLS_04925 [Pyricularia sp. CBS 133598]|nr:hypothetical protein PspLS_04925 [Pyricularia sp. CBS 133598]
MSTTLKSSNNINQRVVDASKNSRMPIAAAAAAPSLAKPALSRAAAAGKTMGLVQASSRAALRSNSGSDTNVDILPQHIRRGPHGSFEWDHGISPQRGPYKDDPHGHDNGYFGPSEAVGSGAAENHRASMAPKPAGYLKNSTPQISHGPSQQIPVKTDQQNMLSKSHKDTFCRRRESPTSSNQYGVAGGAVKAGKES